MANYNLTLLPVTNLVIFPKSVVPFTATNKSTVASLKEAINKDKSLVFLSTWLPKTHAAGEGVYRRGVIGLIKHVSEISDDVAKVVIETFSKGDLVQYHQKSPFYRVEVAPVFDSAMPKVTNEYTQFLNKLKQRLGAYVHGETLQKANTPEDLIAVIVNTFEAPMEVLQKVLEQDNDFGSLLLLNEYMNIRSSLTPAEGMSNMVTQDGKNHQHAAKQSEKQEELEELKERIKKIKFPDHVKKEVDKQVAKLARLSAEMSEYYTTRNYLDWILDIPWNVEDTSEIDLKKVAAEIESSHYGLDDVKDRVMEYLAVQKLKGSINGSILCLISPPGCGKTSVAKSIAKAMNRKFVKISLGGVRDEADIRGHRKTYVGSMPGKIIQALKNAGTMNPVILLDEIDKLGQDALRGSPSAALLEALDPEQNSDFNDHFMNLGIDLSKIMFICTGNDSSTIDHALFDRLEVIRMEGYSEREKVYIANKYLLPEVCEESSIPVGMVTFTDGALSALVSQYTMESGVRELRRKIQTVFRKVAKSIVLGENPEKIEITGKNLSKYLGPEKIHNDKLSIAPVAGLVNGMAWNGRGGDVLPIETVIIPEGKGRVTVTGNLGKVMEESVKVGLAFLRSSCKLPVKMVSMKEVDFHIHFPEGAVPKDGPSAGTAITLALLSSLTGILIPRECAFTGEMTINGAVLAVGGIKEKVLAAKRNGVTHIFIPKSNQKDVEKLDAKDVRALTFFYVGSFYDVWNYLSTLNITKSTKS